MKCRKIIKIRYGDKVSTHSAIFFKKFNPISYTLEYKTF